jgi:hypothetical protein
MSFQPYNSQPKKGLPVWTLAILVFAAIFVVGMIIILIAAANQNQAATVTTQPIAASPIPVPADCFNSSDLVFQNQTPTWNGQMFKEGTRLCIQGKISKVDRNSNPPGLYFLPSVTNPQSNDGSYLAIRLTFELSYVSNALEKLEGQTVRVRSFTDHGPSGWYIHIRDYDWLEVVSFPALKAEIKPK